MAFETKLHLQQEWNPKNDRKAKLLILGVWTYYDYFLVGIGGFVVFWGLWFWYTRDR